MSSFEQERILQSDARVALEKFRDLSNENGNRQLSTRFARAASDFANQQFR
jgi:hypothetical protein